jgi:outer membrane receptor protein involved in Fe transport
LSFLPGFLKYFNIYSNYTYTHSKATIQSRDASSNKPNETEIIRLPGQATHVGNVALAYETSKLLVRIAANFNGKYLSEVGGTADQDLYVNSRLQLDLNASYSINTRFRVFAEFLNLSNQPYESYLGNSDVTAQREFYSWWTRLGLKFDLGGKK